MPLNSFADVQAFFSAFVSQHGIDVSFAPHADFWNRMTYAEFTTGPVLDYTSDPPEPLTDGAGNAVRLLAPGDSANSALVRILKGAIPSFRRMPGGGPFMPADKVAELADWIDRNCPNP